MESSISDGSVLEATNVDFCMENDAATAADGFGVFLNTTHGAWKPTNVTFFVPDNFEQGPE